MLALYNFKIYYYKDKKNLMNSLSYRSDYIIEDNIEEEKKNSLKNFILRRVKFKDFLTVDYSKKKES